jgi:hypothetical protein
MIERKTMTLRGLPVFSLKNRERENRKTAMTVIRMLMFRKKNLSNDNKDKNFPIVFFCTALAHELNRKF